MHDVNPCQPVLYSNMKCMKRKMFGSVSLSRQKLIFASFTPTPEELFCLKFHGKMSFVNVIVRKNILLYEAAKVKSERLINLIDEQTQRRRRRLVATTSEKIERKFFWITFLFYFASFLFFLPNTTREGDRSGIIIPAIPYLHFKD